MELQKKAQGRQVFFIGLVTAFFALLPAILPYGGRFITRGDYLEQQIAFLLETRQVFLSGGAYSPTTFLGTGMVGAYSFYTLGSPFVWPLFLLPEGAMLYGISVMAMLKHAVAVCTAYFYLRRMRTGHLAALAGGVMYAFSGFTIVSAQFYHFTDIVALFPLMLWALEDAMGERRHYGALALACGINAITNYYFYVSTAVFTALYFVFRFFLGEKGQVRSVRFVLSIVAECAIGSLLAGVVLVPSAVAMLSFTRTSGVDAFRLRNFFSPSDVIERMRVMLMPIESGVEHAYYGDAARWSSVAAYLPVCGAAAFIPSRRHKKWLTPLLIVLVLASLYPATNALFSGGTNYIYTRWWYALCLMLCLGAAQAIEQASARTWRIAGAVALGVIALCIGVFLLPKQLLPEAVADFVALRVTKDVQRQLRVFSLAMCALHYVLYFFLAAEKRRQTKWMVAAVCVAAALHYGGFLAINDALIPAGGVQTQKEALTTQGLAERILQTLESRKTGTTYTYRVDSDATVRNFGLLHNEMSIGAFHSLRSGYTSDFVSAAGFGYDESPSALPPDLEPSVRALLSVKRYYAFDRATLAPEGFVYAGEEGGLHVYENTNYVPMGFLYTTYTKVGEAPLSQETIGETMLNAVVLDSGVAEKYAGSLTHAQQWLSWTEAAALRRAAACTDFVMTTKGFSAQIDAKEAGLLFFSVPYDKGFRAYVDGQARDIERVNLSFMAVWVDAGAHAVEFTYATRGQGAGIAASLGAALLLLFGLGRMRRKKGKMTEGFDGTNRHA